MLLVPLRPPIVWLHNTYCSLLTLKHILLQLPYLPNSNAAFNSREQIGFTTIFFKYGMTEQ